MLKVRSFRRTNTKVEVELIFKSSIIDVIYLKDQTISLILTLKIDQRLDVMPHQEVPPILPPFGPE